MLNRDELTGIFKSYTNSMQILTMIQTENKISNKRIDQKNDSNHVIITFHYISIGVEENYKYGWMVSAVEAFAVVCLVAF